MIKKKTGIIRVAKYIRVSTDRQAKAGDSLREQDETLTDYINKNERMILSNTYIDDGISGQKLDRDDFSRLIKDVKADNIDLIIFTKLDRWFRSLRHYLNTQAVLEAHNVSWTAVSQAFFDTTTAHGRAFVAQSMTWAELEAQNDSERILSVFENKVKNGEVISGTAPLGYDIVNKHLVPNADAEKVIKIYEHYHANVNVRELQRYGRSELGIVRGHTQFKRIIKNTKYKGEFRDNKDYCPALVSKEMWEECNRLLSRNQKANKTHDYVFAGLIRCGDCGRMMAAATVTRYQNGKKMEPKMGADGNMNYYKYPTYRCQARTNGNECISTKQYYGSTIERRVLECIKDEIRDYMTKYNASIAPAVNYDAKRKAIEKKIGKLKELYVNDLITLDEYKADKSQYEESLAAIPNESPQVRDLSHLQKVLDMDIDKVYSHMDTLKKNQFWRSFIDVIVLDNNHNMEIKLL
ncbi:Recombinase zinc beta ribbon domain [Popillia japonica]|uniref:Recombinase zinc beta ribbon domain n=1 Tax=Popillia japonica TaxID=7064 RepID=A0AAW1HV75_POPJA